MELFALSNARGMELRFAALGGVIASIVVPDRNGSLGDVVLGYDSLKDYAAGIPYAGALIGRYANRIAGGRFPLDGESCQLSRNEGPNHLHGGPGGFHAVVWRVTPTGRDAAVLEYTSPAGEEGYPGTLSVRVTYSLTDHDELAVTYHATTDHPTPVNLTQHSYFNLGDTGDINGHELWLNASEITAVDAALIPTGALVPVRGTPFDFTRPRPIGAGRYDCNFVLAPGAGRGLRPAARLFDPDSGRLLEIETTAPGIQLYSGDGMGAGPTGKEGRTYGPRSGLALETQCFPDSPNHPEFPSTVVRPGEVWASRTVYRFSALRDAHLR
jgi:aldose 1-epimerase